MCGCGMRCNCPACRAARDAGFLDSGPYAEIAAARFDGMGPGVNEAGATQFNQGNLLPIVGLGALAYFLFWAKK